METDTSVAAAVLLSGEISSFFYSQYRESFSKLRGALLPTFRVVVTVCLSDCLSDKHTGFSQEKQSIGAS